MKKVVRVLCLFICAAVLFGACGQAPSVLPGQEEPPAASGGQVDMARGEQLHALAVQLLEYRLDGDNDAALAMMTEELQAAVKTKLGMQWLSMAVELGEFLRAEDWEGTDTGEYFAVELTLIFEKGRYIQRTVFDTGDLIAGLSYRAGAVAPQMPLPENVAEEAVVVDAGEGYPLDGLLTLPGAEEPVAAVVLVHGSGPADRNSYIGANMPFRDIAYLLGQRGIAVLRYDKRTYTYGAQMAADPGYPQTGVDEETANDAAAAVALLKGRPEIDPARIFLLGHSMGGGLLSYVGAKGADCAGYIIMAGTPRQMWELSLEQTERLAREEEEAGNAVAAAQIRAQAAANAQKAAAAAGLDDEAALDPANAAYGLSAWYWRSFARVDTVALHLADQKPVLVLQGGRDRQVTETDYELWQSGLAEHPDAEYRWYPELNHLMGHYPDEEVPFAQMVNMEYTLRTPVPGEVADDIAAWTEARA